MMKHPHQVSDEKMKEMLAVIDSAREADATDSSNGHNGHIARQALQCPFEILAEDAPSENT